MLFRILWASWNFSEMFPMPREPFENIRILNHSFGSEWPVPGPPPRPAPQLPSLPHPTLVSHHLKQLGLASRSSFSLSSEEGQSEEPSSSSLFTPRQRHRKNCQGCCSRLGWSRAIKAYENPLCIYLFPNLCSVTSPWKLEISHSRSIYLHERNQQTRWTRPCLHPTPRAPG